MRRCLLLLAAAACSSHGSHDRNGDPAVGRWQGESKVVELRADGTLDITPITPPDCEDATAVIDACRARQRWSRSGSTVTLVRAAIARKPPMPMSSPGPCECRLEHIEVELRGDELVAGTEHAHRVTTPKPTRDPAP